MACSALSGARPAGCALRPPATRGPWRQQAVLGRSRWDADGLRADDRTRAGGRCAVRLGGHRHGLWRGPDRDAVAPGRQGYVLGAHATDQFSSWIDKPDVAGTAEQIAK